MKNLKITLWVTGIGCLVAVPFMVLPWSVLERIVLWFGVEPIPRNPLVEYLLRVSCGVYGLIGVYFMILAKDPLKYGPLLSLGAYGLIIFSLLSLFAGVSLDLSPKIYVGDFLSGFILGCVIITLSSKVRKELRE